MKENLYRFAFWILILAAILVFGSDLIAQEKKPTPAVKLDVYPRLFLTFPNSEVTFRVRWQIERHPDNRKYSIAFACASGHSRSSEGDMEGEKSPYTFPEWYPEVETGGGCNFEACVYRKVGKPFKCATVTVKSSVEEEP